MSDKKKLFVERRPEGDFAVRKGNSERASDVLPTQKAAIERARELNPGHSPDVERVRHTIKGNPTSGARRKRWRPSTPNAWRGLAEAQSAIPIARERRITPSANPSYARAGTAIITSEAKCPRNQYR